jgi:hypothetical protein
MPLFMTGDDKENEHLENDKYISVRHPFGLFSSLSNVAVRYITSQ